MSLALLAPLPAMAGTTWDGGGANASWGTLANWNPDGLPVFDGTEAITIGNSFTSGTTLTLDGTRYMNSLTLSGASSFTIAAGTGGTINLRSGNLTQTTGSGAARTISAGIVLGDPTGAAAYSGIFTIAGDFELSITGNITEAGGSRSLTLTGGRFLRLSGNNTFSGGLTITLGTLFVSANENLGASTGSVTMNGGNLAANGSFVANRNLTLNSTNGAFIIDPGNVVEFTGSVAGNGDLRVTSGGTLILSGAGSNGSGGGSIGPGSVLALRNGVSFGTGTLTMSGGVLELGSGNFTRNLGTGAGQVNMSGTGGAGFAAWGADRIVNLGGSGAMVTWGSGSFINNLIDGGTGLGTPLRLGSVTANATVDFQNGINLVNTGRNVQVTKGTGSGPDGELSGVISSTGTSGGLTVRSTNGGRLLLSNGNNSYQGNTTINSGELWLGANATSGAGNTVLGSSTSAIGIVNEASLMTAAPITIGRNIALASGTSSLATLGGVTADTSVFSGTITLGSTTVSGRDVTLSAVSGGTVTFSGPIIDPTGLTGTSGAITKTGDGTVVLSGANTYAGTTTVNAGVLRVQNSAGLGAATGGTTINSGGELQLQGGVAVAPELLMLNGSGVNGGGALRNMSGNNSWAGNITLATTSLIQALLGQLTLSGTLGNGGNGADFHFDGAGNTLVLGPITNNADVVKNGSGTLTLQGANTYTGGTFVNGGTLLLTGSLNGTAGTALTFGGDGAFDFNAAPGTAQGMGTLTFSAGHGTVESTYGGSGNTSLTFSSLAPRGVGASGNFVISGGTNGTTNKIVLTGQPSGFIDTATFFNGDEYAYVDASGYVRGINYGVDPGTAVSNGGISLSGDHVKTNGHINSQGTQRFETLHIASNIQYTLGNSQKVTVSGILKTGNVPGGATISGGAYLEADPNAEMTIRTARENDFLTIITPIVANGINAVTKTGSGTLTLSGVNTYSGGTYVTDGTLKIGASERLLNTGSLTVAGGTFDVQNFTETVGTVTLSSGTISGTGTGTVIGSSYDVQSGSVSAILAGPSSLAKNTEGTVTLTGVNTYTGTTTVNTGDLVAAAPSGSALGSTSAIIINADGDLILGASNQINNVAPVTLAGGTLSTGGFSEGTTSSAGAGALNLTAVGSTIDFGTGATGTLAFAIFNPGGNSLTIDNWTGTPGLIGDGTTDQLLFATDPTPNLGSFTFTGYDSGGVAILLSSGFYEVTPGLAPVPEVNPTMAAAFVCLFGLLALKTSRRQLRRLFSQRQQNK